MSTIEIESRCNTDIDNIPRSRNINTFFSESYEKLQRIENDVSTGVKNFNKFMDTLKTIIPQSRVDDLKNLAFVLKKLCSSPVYQDEINLELFRLDTLVINDVNTNNSTNNTSHNTYLKTMYHTCNILTTITIALINRINNNSDIQQFSNNIDTFDKEALNHCICWLYYSCAVSQIYGQDNGSKNRSILLSQSGIITCLTNLFSYHSKFSFELEITNILSSLLSVLADPSASYNLSKITLSPTTLSVHRQVSFDILPSDKETSNIPIHLNLIDWDTEIKLCQQVILCLSMYLKRSIPENVPTFELVNYTLLFYCVAKLLKNPTIHPTSKDIVESLIFKTRFVEQILSCTLFCESNVNIKSIIIYENVIFGLASLLTIELKWFYQAPRNYKLGDTPYHLILNNFNSFKNALYYFFIHRSTPLNCKCNIANILIFYLADHGSNPLILKSDPCKPPLISVKFHLAILDQLSRLDSNNQMKTSCWDLIATLLSSPIVTVEAVMGKTVARIIIDHGFVSIAINVLTKVSIFNKVNKCNQVNNFDVEQLQCFNIWTLAASSLNYLAIHLESRRDFICQQLTKSKAWKCIEKYRSFITCKDRFDFTFEISELTKFINDYNSEKSNLKVSKSKSPDSVSNPDSTNATETKAGDKTDYVESKDSLISHVEMDKLGTSNDTSNNLNIEESAKLDNSQLSSSSTSTLELNTSTNVDDTTTKLDYITPIVKRESNKQINVQQKANDAIHSFNKLMKTFKAMTPKISTDELQNLGFVLTRLCASNIFENYLILELFHLDTLVFNDVTNDVKLNNSSHKTYLQTIYQTCHMLTRITTIVINRINNVVKRPKTIYNFQVCQMDRDLLSDCLCWIYYSVLVTRLLGEKRQIKNRHILLSQSGLIQCLTNLYSYKSKISFDSEISNILVALLSVLADVDTSYNLSQMNENQKESVNQQLLFEVWTPVITNDNPEIIYVVDFKSSPELERSRTTIHQPLITLESEVKLIQQIILSMSIHLNRSNNSIISVFELKNYCLLFYRVTKLIITSNIQWIKDFILESLMLKTRFLEQILKYTLFCESNIRIDAISIYEHVFLGLLRILTIDLDWYYKSPRNYKSNNTPYHFMMNNWDSFLNVTYYIFIHRLSPSDCKCNILSILKFYGIEYETNCTILKLTPLKAPLIPTKFQIAILEQVTRFNNNDLKEECWDLIVTSLNELQESISIQIGQTFIDNGLIPAAINVIKNVGIFNKYKQDNFNCKEIQRYKIWSLAVSSLNYLALILAKDRNFICQQLMKTKAWTCIEKYKDFISCDELFDQCDFSIDDLTEFMNTFNSQEVAKLNNVVHKSKKLKCVQKSNTVSSNDIQNSEYIEPKNIVDKGRLKEEHLESNNSSDIQPSKSPLSNDLNLQEFDIKKQIQLILNQSTNLGIQGNCVESEHVKLDNQATVNATDIEISLVQDSFISNTQTNNFIPDDDNTTDTEEENNNNQTPCRFSADSTDKADSTENNINPSTFSTDSTDKEDENNNNINPCRFSTDSTDKEDENNNSGCATDKEDYEEDLRFLSKYDTFLNEHRIQDDDITKLESDFLLRQVNGYSRHYQEVAPKQTLNPIIPTISTKPPSIKNQNVEPKNNLIPKFNIGRNSIHYSQYARFQLLLYPLPATWTQWDLLNNIFFKLFDKSDVNHPLFQLKDFQFAFKTFLTRGNTVIIYHHNSKMMNLMQRLFYTSHFYFLSLYPFLKLESTPYPLSIV